MVVLLKRNSILYQDKASTTLMTLNKINLFYLFQRGKSTMELYIVYQEHFQPLENLYLLVHFKLSLQSSFLSKRIEIGEELAQKYCN